MKQFNFFILFYGFLSFVLANPPGKSEEDVKEPEQKESISPDSDNTNKKNESVVGQTIYPLVRVTTEQGGGSGVLVYSDDKDVPGKFVTFLFTNHHVIDSAIHIVKTWDNLRQSYIQKEVNDLVNIEIFGYENDDQTVIINNVKAEVVAYIADEDLALLKLVHDFEIKNLAKLLPLTEKIGLLDPVIAVGCQNLSDPFPTTGIITDLNVLIDKKRYVGTSANIYFGSSGGAVYVQKSDAYYFAGIPSRITVDRGQALSYFGFFIPVERIHEFIETQKLSFLIDESKTPKECFEEREKLRQGSSKTESF